MKTYAYNCSNTESTDNFDTTVVEKKFRIFGEDGHRMAASFRNSTYFDFSCLIIGSVRIIKTECFDITGTNDYIDVTIIRNTAEECDHELQSQLDDGYFENYRYGKIVEL